jgi:hypothetical protein
MNSINNQNEITPYDKTMQFSSIFSPSISLFISSLKNTKVLTKLKIYILLVTYYIVEYYLIT